MQSCHDIAIVGGGASAVLASLQFLRRARQPLQLAMLAPDPQPGRGVAYSTRRPEHLLNVPAGRMSALAERPDDLVEWLATEPDHAGIDRHELASRFIARRDYARYLAARLEQARAASPARLEQVQARVLALHAQDGHWRLETTAGPVLARRVLLAAGNAARPLPARGATTLSGPALLQAWDYEAVAALDPDSDVAVVGTGLSMADVLVSLEAGGHRGRIHLLSRHALLPLAHAGGHHGVDPELDVASLHPLPLRARLRRLRAQARDARDRGLPWQAVMEALRPHGHALWQSLPPAEQRRFLRHGMRWWDIHRHRLAPEVAARLEQLRAQGRLHLHRARLDLVVSGSRCVRLSARRADGSELCLDVDHIINATGMETRIQAMRNPLLEQLLGTGLARPGGHGMGLDSDPAGRVVDAAGQARDGLRVIGSLRIGQEWETIAVPDLRLQAAAIAGDWLG